MVRKKKREILCLILMSLAAAYCVGLIVTACNASSSITNEKNTSSSGMQMQYETQLFDSSIVHTIDVQMSENDWETLKERAIYKEYYDCNLLVDGEMYYHVGVRTKGNSTLVESIARDWNRHSLVFDFSQFNESRKPPSLTPSVIFPSLTHSQSLRKKNFSHWKNPESKSNCKNSVRGLT